MTVNQGWMMGSEELGQEGGITGMHALLFKIFQMKCRVNELRYYYCSLPWGTAHAKVLLSAKFIKLAQDQLENPRGNGINSGERLKFL